MENYKFDSGILEKEEKGSSPKEKNSIAKIQN